MARKDSAAHGRRDVWTATALVGATVLAYLPSLAGEIIWNDIDYVTRPVLRSLDGLGRIWTELGATEQYYPVLHSWFWLQYLAWGDHPLPYHVVTVLLHATAAVMFGVLLRRLAVPGPWLGALLFALHPVHVESVAWITEQKNTLSMVFYLAAALLYLRFDETRRPRTYVAALALFVLSLACKTVTATLPAALLVVLWWKRGRLQARRDWLPLGGWLAIGAAAGLFTSWVETNVLHAEGKEFALSLVERGLVAGRAVWFYLGQLVWPFELNFIYPRWTPDATIWWQWAYPLGLVAVAGALWVWRRRNRAPLAAFLFFAGSLFPVLGFVNLYGARYSFVWDHWQYLPDLGPLALAAAGLTLGWRRIADRAPPWTAIAAAGTLALGLGGLSWRHCGMFKNDDALYRTTLARNPDCWMAHFNLGLMLQQTPAGVPEAMSHFEAAVRLKPDHDTAHYQLGRILMDLPGRRADAMEHFHAAVTHRPDYVQARVDLGIELARLPGRLPEAIAQFEAALRVRPDFPEAHNALGNALQQIPGRLPEAITHFEAALRLNPRSPEAHNNLGFALTAIPERLPEAVQHFETALRAMPDQPVVHNNLALALARLPGRRAEAVRHFETAVRLQPDFAQAHYHLGLLLAEQSDRRPEALEHLEAALRLRPELEAARQTIKQLRAAQP